MTTTAEEAEWRARRLDPAVLRADAAGLLRKTHDPVDLVASLLRTIRMQHDEAKHIRDGYGSSQQNLLDLHRQHVEDVRRDIARAIRREVGKPPPSGKQHLTYDGGLRRAARIAEGWALR